MSNVAMNNALIFLCGLLGQLYWSYWKVLEIFVVEIKWWHHATVLFQTSMQLLFEIGDHFFTSLLFLDCGPSCYSSWNQEMGNILGCSKNIIMPLEELIKCTLVFINKM